MLVDLIKYYEKNNKINIFTSSDQIKIIGLIVENEIFDSLGDIVSVHTLTGELYSYYISIDNEYLDEEDFFENEFINVSNEKLNNFLKIEFDDYETTKDKWNKDFSDFIHSIKFDEEVEYDYNEEE